MFIAYINHCKSSRGEMKINIEVFVVNDVLQAVIFAGVVQTTFENFYFDMQNTQNKKRSYRCHYLVLYTRRNLKNILKIVQFFVLED